MNSCWDYRLHLFTVNNLLAYYCRNYNHWFIIEQISSISLINNRMHHNFLHARIAILLNFVVAGRWIDSISKWTFLEWYGIWILLDAKGWAPLDYVITIIIYAARLLHCKMLWSSHLCDDSSAIGLVMFTNCHSIHYTMFSPDLHYTKGQVWPDWW